MKRLVKILKNLEKRCKVLQKSKFGGSENHEKLSLESKLGAILALSWLVGAQIGAKRGKLTSLGGLRGPKLELKGALGEAMEAPKELQRATRDFGPTARGAISELGGPP